MITYNYGGGVQSNAVMVLIVRGELPRGPLIFSNVGDDSEDPDTLKYLDQHAQPYARRHGLDLITVQKTLRDGTPETIHSRIMRPGSKSLPIPVRGYNGAPGSRSCTAEFKIRVIGAWQKAHGATPDDPATTCIGISTDEIARARTRSPIPWQRLSYPLIDLGISRDQCAEIITSAGLPVPPKSACWFCPLHRVGEWARMKVDQPAKFERACAFEDQINQTRMARGAAPMFLSRYAMPLRDVQWRQLPAPTADDTDMECDSGHCFT